ncbi:MAG: DUF1574 domain-containing protein [Leptospiraceae bacterium]|nr:DUF1574 domain-containing protein [Leptospiraceae bacterium]MCK6380820.1 DUF1574 domain-containing protein [Leptospiraceae bacterium]NUM40771.1 DUF1574 domain-containing protein [Leptospiraceae bacterium]
MRKNKFLLYPIFLFTIIFLFDKIFFLEEVKSYLKTDFTYIYYETKKTLLQNLVKENSSRKKKLMIVLGSSRLLYFDAKDLSDFYPDWDIYNFSSAVTTPAYYLFYLEKILENGIRPDLILLETDPNQFNENSKVFRGSNLTYSFDLPFVFKYATAFGKDNLSFYLGKTFFGVSKNKPYLNVALKRLSDPRFIAVAEMGKTTKKFLLDNKGNALSPIENYVEKDFGILEATSQRTIDWLFSNYRDSKMQYYFFEEILRKIASEKIPLLIVWPQSSIPMQQKLKSSKFVTNWEEKTKKLTSTYNFEILDMDNTKEYYCNSFADGGHISKDCYHPFMRFVMYNYFKKYN